MRSGFVAVIVLVLSTSSAVAADLQPRTVAAFDRYVAAAERDMAATLDTPARFLWVDTRPDPDRREDLASLRAGGLLIERIDTREAGKKIDAPAGLIHH